MLTENRDKRTRKQKEKIKKRLSQKKMQKKRDRRRSNARDAKYQHTPIYDVESTRTSQSLREELIGLGLPRTGNRQALIERLSHYNKSNNDNKDNNIVVDDVLRPPTISKRQISMQMESPEDIDLLCVITQELLVDPVNTCDGQTYSRAAILRWLSNHNTSPATNIPLENKELIPNLEKRERILIYKQKYGRELIGKNLGQFHTDFDFPRSNRFHFFFSPYLFLQDNSLASHA